MLAEKVHVFSHKFVNEFLIWRIRKTYTDLFTCGPFGPSAALYMGPYVNMPLIHTGIGSTQFHAGVVYCIPTPAGGSQLSSAQLRVVSRKTGPVLEVRQLF